MSPLDRQRGNAAVCWVLLSAAVAAAGALLAAGRLFAAGVAATAGAVGAVPAAVTRDPVVCPPWALLAVAVVPPAAVAFLGAGLPAPVGLAGVFLTVAAVALLLAAHLEAFTPVGLSPGFAGGFVVAFTTSVASLRTVARWLADGLFGTALLRSVHGVMGALALATAVGLVGGAATALALAADGDLPRPRGNRR